MNYIVVFFTRTKASQRVAEKIASQLGCKTVEITDHMNWKGIFGFIKAGFYSSTNRPVKIEVLGSLGDADEFIVVGPLWAGGLAPALTAFLKTLPPEKVHLVVTSDGSAVKNRSGYKSVSDVVKSQVNEDLVIAALVKRLAKNKGG